MWATRRSVAAAYTVVIPFIFAYLSLLIRMVEDPFTYPARYNQNCLLQSKREVPPLSWVILPQVLRCSIDLQCPAHPDRLLRPAVQEADSRHAAADVDAGGGQRRARKGGARLSGRPLSGGRRHQRQLEENDARLERLRHQRAEGDLVCRQRSGHFDATEDCGGTHRT